MPKHIKPTKEELVEIEQKAIEEAEKLKDLPVKDEEAPTDIPESEPEAEIEPSEEVFEPEEEEEEAQAEPSEEEKQRLKEKLSASARENQKIYAKNRVINKALADADDIPEPTEEELEKEFKDWDIMSDTERVFAKETVVSKRWRNMISSAKEQATKIEKWNDSVEEFINDAQTLAKNPELEDRLDAFKEFATTEENNSVPMKILVSAFLHEQTKGKVKNKGKMFEKGLGGSTTAPEPKSNKLTVEEGRKLRETNYDKWKEYLQADKIEKNF